MDCKNHPGVPAAVNCAGCAEPYCGNCSLTINGQSYCGSCKVLALGGKAPVVESATRLCEEAKSALIFAFVGMCPLCFGFVLGPIAIIKGFGARKLIKEDPTLLGWGRATAAIIIGFSVSAFWVFVLLNQIKGHSYR
jgi:hypothetical protein